MKNKRILLYGFVLGLFASQGVCLVRDFAAEMAAGAHLRESLGCICFDLWLFARYRDLGGGCGRPICFDRVGPAESLSLANTGDEKEQSGA